MTETNTQILKESSPAPSSKNALLVGDDEDVKSALSSILVPEGWTLEQSPSLETR